MATNDKYELEDLITTSLEQKPVEFGMAFNDLLLDRLHAAVENKKIEYAKQMYGYDAPEETKSSPEEK